MKTLDLAVVQANIVFGVKRQMLNGCFGRQQILCHEQQKCPRDKSMRMRKFTFEAQKSQGNRQNTAHSENAHNCDFEPLREGTFVNLSI